MPVVCLPHGSVVLFFLLLFLTWVKKNIKSTKGRSAAAPWDSPHKGNLSTNVNAIKCLIKSHGSNCFLATLQQAVRHQKLFTACLLGIGTRCLCSDLVTVLVYKPLTTLVLVIGEWLEPVYPIHKACSLLTWLQTPRRWTQHGLTVVTTGHHAPSSLVVPLWGWLKV